MTRQFLESIVKHKSIQCEKTLSGGKHFYGFRGSKMQFPRTRIEKECHRRFQAQKGHLDTNLGATNRDNNCFVVVESSQIFNRRLAKLSCSSLNYGIEQSRLNATMCQDDQHLKKNAPLFWPSFAKPLIPGLRSRFSKREIVIIHSTVSN